MASQAQANKSSAAAAAAQGIEYTIYTFDHPQGGAKKQPKWQKHESGSEMQEALKKAEELFRAGQYQKVEVKQKYFDKKKNRNIDVTLRVFEKEKKRDFKLAFIFVFAVLCGAAAFGLTYYLTQ